QIVFARFRIRVTAGLVPGATYTMTAPYGTQSFVATATGTINFTSDQGCLAPPCNFASLLTNTNVGPFVRWDATSAPPAGFIGQPAIAHRITGSPFNTNFFRLSGPNVGGPGVNTVETNLFNVTGKRLVSTVLTPGPPTLGPLRRKKLVLKGLPVMRWAIAGWPMNPAGGADVASHLTNGPTFVLVRRLAKLQGGARHPWSLVKLIVPVAVATKDWVPYGAVIVYVAPGTRPAVTRMRKRAKTI